ncbi:unnamed protein product [Blepharisma stoltei]|uniref:Uncharacterized protein n=1 Tax=Blepharisma stoltei TaxID=1481888 RepID=A0AAU9J7H4_9CILI|nr:unnamed protein product [Blepharisma stoltei]
MTHNDYNDAVSVNIQEHLKQSTEVLENVINKHQVYNFRSNNSSISQSPTKYLANIISYAPPKTNINFETISLPKINKPSFKDQNQYKSFRSKNNSPTPSDNHLPYIPFYPKFCNKIMNFVTFDKKIINYKTLLEELEETNISTGNLTNKNKKQVNTYIPNSNLFNKLNAAISMKNLDFDQQRINTRSLSPYLNEKHRLKINKKYAIRRSSNLTPMFGLSPVNKPF